MVHLKVYLIVLTVLVALFGAAILHSRLCHFSGGEATALKTISPVLPSADPGMDNSARYIRHLGLSTPGSAFPDYPGQLDYLPAGVAWPPPLQFTGLVGAIRMGETTPHNGEACP